MARDREGAVEGGEGECRPTKLSISIGAIYFWY